VVFRQIVILKKMLFRKKCLRIEIPVSTIRINLDLFLLVDYFTSTFYLKNLVRPIILAVATPGSLPTST